MAVTTNINAPKIDNYAAARIGSDRALYNVVQRLIWKNGRGVTDEYAQNVAGSEIRVIKQTLPATETRQLGNNTNGDHFNSGTELQPISEEHGIQLREVFDLNTGIPRVLQDMIYIDVLNQTLTGLEQMQALHINAFTLATQLAKVLNADYDLVLYGTGDEDLTKTILHSTTIGTDNFYDAFNDATTALDDGDYDNGIHTFPVENRIAVFTSEGKKELRSSEGAVYEVGSSKGVELITIGAVGEPQYEMNTHVDGYFGHLLDTPLHMMSSAIVKQAEIYLGLTAGDLDGLLGVVSASEATGRGIDFGSMKIIDHEKGQGLKIQPLTRFGATTWYQKGVQVLVTSAFSNPSTGSLEVIGAGSRD